MLEQETRTLFFGMALAAAITWTVIRDPESKDHLESICSSISRFADQIPTYMQWNVLREKFEGLDAAVIRCGMAGHEVYRISQP
jgi:hypothetical protein